MGVLKRVRGWLREYPIRADALLALLVLLGTALPFFDELRDRLNAERPPLVVVLVVVCCGCLVLRRRFPWWVWGVTTTLGLVGVVLTEAPSPVYVPAVVALYTVSARVATVHVVWAAALSTLVPTTLIIGLGPLRIFDDLAYAMVMWSVLAAVSGIAVRSQRAVVEAARERARQAEATWEEEAQRRVAEERLRIARELHDVVAHHVSVISVQAGVAGHLVRSDPDGAAAAIAHVREASQTVLREVPGLLGLLRTGDEELETAPVPRLEDAARLVEQARRSGLQVVWKTSGTPTPLPPSTDLTAYRVVQEGLTNAGRHGTGQVLLQLAYEPGGLAIEMRNAQAQPTTTAATGRHGLIGMRERVASAGGTLTVGPADLGTWTVRAWLPVSARTSEQQEVRSR